jgi:hypothetical protein
MTRPDTLEELNQRTTVELARERPRERRCAAAIAAVVALACACSKSAARAPSTTLPRYTLEFAPLVNTTEIAPDAEHRINYHGGIYTIESKRRFAVQEAHEMTGPQGQPAIEFEIAEPEQAEFKRWTAEHLAHGIALFIDGKVIRIVARGAPTSGRILIAPEGKPWSEDVARDLASGLVPGQ